MFLPPFTNFHYASLQNSQPFFLMKAEEGKKNPNHKTGMPLLVLPLSINGPTLSLVLLWLITYRMFSFNYSVVKTMLKALGPYFITISTTKMFLRVKHRRFGGCIVCHLISSGGFSHFCLIKLLQYFQPQTYQILSLNVHTDQTDAYNKSEHKRNTMKLDLFSLLSEPMSGYKPPSKSYTLASQRV